ncbi:MAG: flagellar assembly peptidoglycan hydrolase FlgJ [Nitrosomonas sp.]|nr:flagellar assembly peptidoglycan hydrolase FlgJ [Nitrosomonas sp.]
MINTFDFTSKLAIDSKSIDDMQLLSRQDSKKALREAAKQFEALFFQMLVKSMRDATLKSGLIDSQQTQFYVEMYDQQLSQTLAGKGIGLADMMVEQLTRTYYGSEATANLSQSAENEPSTHYSGEQTENNPITPANPLISQLSENEPPAPISQIPPESSSKNVVDNQSNPIAATIENSFYTSWYQTHDTTRNTIRENDISSNGKPNDVFIAEQIAKKPSRSAFNKTADFINTLMPHASAASELTGIPAHFMLAQAALESGWGKHEIRHPDNSTSYNLFGIKASSNWKGKTVEILTTEYINGTPKRIVEKFRAYDSYEESFRDYANLLTKNPRYSHVVNTQNAAEFAYGLQKAGYATDPHYGNKLMRILSNPALQNQEFI